MNFETTEGYEEERAAAEAFALREVAPSAVARDRASAWDADLFRRMGSAGLLGTLAPRAHGGRGLGSVHLCAAQEGFGKGASDAGLALAWSAHMLLCALPIERFGTEAQRRRFLPALCRGERVGALAHRDRTSERPTRAVRRGDRWVLDGRKRAVVNGPAAQVFVITAVTDPSRGEAGVSAFVVDRDTRGIEVGTRKEIGGLRTATISDVMLEGCEVGADALLGELGTGVTQTLRTTRLWERACGLGSWIGMLRTLLEGSVRQVRDTSELRTSQAVRSRIADMRIEVELCRRLQIQAAWRVGTGERGAEQDALVARLFIARAARSAAQHAAEIAGLDGLEAGHALERLRRDALALDVVSGETDDVLRSVLGRSLVGLDEGSEAIRERSV